MKALAATQTTSSPSSTTGSNFFLQRKCACGGSAGLSGTCEECADKKLLGQPLQAKLVVGSADDPLEREADRVADQVMATPAKPTINNAPPSIQRFAGQPTGQTDAVPASVERTLASSGRPLEPALRHDMELRFGHDFSRVRVHSGAPAEQSARDVNAHAYTTGTNIVFGAGRFAPETQEGRRLIAHELMHVIQQQQSGEVSIQRWPSWDEVREAGYSYMINGLRSLQREGLGRLREWSATLTPIQQTIANGIITAVEAISEILIELIFAVVGLIVGFVAGIVQMIVGLFDLVVGIVRGILLFLYGFIDGGAAFDEWANGVLEAISNIPEGLRALITTWLTEFEHASSDRQTVMIGELTGQIIAIIATFEVAATRAGSLPRITATLPRVTLPVIEAAPELAAVGGRGLGTGVRVGSRVVGGSAVSIDASIPATATSQAIVASAAMSSVSDLYGEGPETDAIHETDRRRAGMAERPQHHIFPREYRESFFEPRGFDDIDDFCVELEEAHHQAVHGGGDWRLGRTWPNEWNQRIIRELTEAESYMGRSLTREEIITIGREVMVEYGIDADFVRWRGAR